MGKSRKGGKDKEAECGPKGGREGGALKRRAGKDKNWKKDRHRGREVGGAVVDDEKFARQLLSKGLRFKEMAGDGNCLFASVADQLWGEPWSHGTVREALVSYVERAREYFEPFTEDDEPFDDYIDRMRNDAQWGGHQELVAASQYYEASIFVHQLDAPCLGIRRDSPSREMHLSYHGNFHYNSVRLASAPDDSGPPKKLPSSSSCDFQSAVEKEPNGGSSEQERGGSSTPGVVDDATPSSDHPTSPSSPKLEHQEIPTKSLARIRRGAQCPCGSGKKYKKCCKKNLTRVAKRVKPEEDEEEEVLPSALMTLVI